MSDQLYTGAYCQPNGRTSQLEQCMSRTAPAEFQMRTRTAHPVKKATISSVIDALHHLPPSSNAKGCHANRGFNADVDDQMFQGQSPKRSRAKESSKHFGVRFRPDLQKWVAEIRVAEWKTVDKKVWLGTFDSEEGAARAVDAARALLKCKKKRLPNFPCESLDAYSERIPTNLNLNNLRDDSMFKEVIVFVKRKAQEYAASFCSYKTTCAISISTDQVLTTYSSLQELPQGFAMQEADNMSMASYVGTSYGSSTGSYNTQQGAMAGQYDGQWMSPTSVTYCSAPSSAGTSPDDHKSWFYLDNNSCYGFRQSEMTQIEEQSVEGDWTAVHLQSVTSHENRGSVWEGQNIGSDGQYVLPDNDNWLSEVTDLLFPYDDEIFENLNQTPVDIVPRDEMLYVESQNLAYSVGDPSSADWIPPVPQQNFNSYSSLMSSMDYTQVC